MNSNYFRRNSQATIAILSIFFSRFCLAQVTLDGTLGNDGALSGPDYHISADLGRQIGDNLFHSFGIFNIGTGESATFTGPPSVENILGRVTGGIVSNIDGVIRSTIPGANLYLINPAGIIFGENARLDVQGSFHASTADYIGFEDGVHFNALPSADGVVFSAAPAKAFGFLGANPNSAGISVESGSFNFENAVINFGLFVPLGQTLSLVGGDVSVHGSVLAALKGRIDLVGGDVSVRGSLLAASTGRINIASINSPSEVIMTDVGLETDSSALAGDITISDSSVLIVNGNRGGQVAIRGGQFVLENRSKIFAVTGEEPGLGIDLEVDQLTVKNSSLINSRTAGSGTAGPLVIRAETLEIAGSEIISDTFCRGENCGDAGVLRIDGSQIRLLNGGQIGSVSFGDGDGGNIIIDADDSLAISGSVTIPTPIGDRVIVSAIGANTQGGSGQGGTVQVNTPILEIRGGGIAAQSACGNCGDGGTVRIEAGQIRLLEGGQIGAGTFGLGNGGNVTVTATESITITGSSTRVEGDTVRTAASGIAASTRGLFANGGRGGSVEVNTPVLHIESGGISTTSFCNNCDNAGDVRVNADTIRLLGGADISASTKGDGDAGNVTVKATESITISGFDVDESQLPSQIISSTEGGSGEGGSLHVETPELNLRNRGLISTESECEFCGIAGNITLDVDRLNIQDAAISTKTILSGGGNIDIQARDLISLTNGEITTSVAGGDEDAGNITIDPVFVVLQDQSKIIANAQGGAGGNISISITGGGAFFQSPDSIVEASSNFGVDGSVKIDSPDTDIMSGLDTFPAAFFDGTHLLSTPCSYRSGTDVSELIVKSYEVLPDSPYAFTVQLPELVTGYSEPDSGEEDFRNSSQSTGQDVRVLEKSNYYLSADPSRNDIDVFLSQATLFYAKGQIKRAVNALNKAGLLVDSESDPARMALVLGGISDGYLLTRRLNDAMSNAKRSVDLARRAENPQVLAAGLNYFGNVLAAQRRYGESLKAYQEALAITERSPDSPLTSNLTLNILRAEMELDNTSLNATRLSAAINKFQSLPASTQKGHGFIAIGHLAQRLMASTQTSREALSQLANKAFIYVQYLAEVLDNSRLRSYAIGHLGELYALHGFDLQSEQLFRRALFFAEEAGAFEVSGRWHMKLGELLYQNGRHSEAKSAYKNAIDKFDTIERALLYGRRGQPALFSETVGNVYRRLAEITLQEIDIGTESSRRDAALRSVREVMERFKVAELRNHFQDECINTHLEQTRKTKIDALLNPRTATLYPIIFPDHLSLLVSFEDGALHSVDVPVNSVELKKELISFRKLLHFQGDIGSLRNVGSKLYQWLIEPVVPFLEQHEVESMIVVPDGALSTIPFAALYDGHEFLVNRYAFALSPGLTMTDVQRVEPESGLTLLAGITESVQGYSALPFVGTEISEVASIYGGKLLMDESFKKSEVEAELNRTPYRVINFATHAEIASDPRQSFLLTYDDKISFDELEDLIRIGQFREQPLDLLVLSACSTAAGDERAALGLAGIAVKAGAQSVIGSLWNVNDASTAKLIPAVFQNLKIPSMSKIRALQSAQQQLLSDSKYKHPYYWAPLVLIGNWR